MNVRTTNALLNRRGGRGRGRGRNETLNYFSTVREGERRYKRRGSTLEDSSSVVSSAIESSLVTRSNQIQFLEENLSAIRIIQSDTSLAALIGSDSSNELRRPPIQSQSEFIDFVRPTYPWSVRSAKSRKSDKTATSRPTSFFDNAPQFVSSELADVPVPGGSNGRSFLRTPRTTSDENKSPDYGSILLTPVGLNQLPRLPTHLFDSKARLDPGDPFGSTSSTKTTEKSSKKTSTKTDFTSNEGFIVVALTEGRGIAVGEVGMAVIDLKKPVLTLCQISDSQTYTKTMVKMNVFSPDELIIPNTFTGPNSDSDLFKRVTNYFLNTKVVAVQRQLFSGESGIDSIRTLSLPQCSAIDIITMRKYYALSAAAALLKYIEREHKIIFAKQSLFVKYESAIGTVALDIESSRRLELIMTHGDMIHPEKYSLFGVLDHTVTIGGRRRLRSEILQPITSLTTLEDRLDTVTYFKENHQYLMTLQKMLSKFTKVERLLWLGRKTPNFKQEQKTNENLTNFLVLLKDTMDNVPLLRDLVNESTVHSFVNIRNALSDKNLDTLTTTLLGCVRADIKPGTGHLSAELNRIYLVKEGVNGLLDVARETYSSLVDEARGLIEGLAETYNLPLRMTQSAGLGFHAVLNVDKRGSLRGTLPEIFTDVRYQGRSIHLSTDALFGLNTRIQKVVQEIHLISNAILYELMKELRTNIGALYALCDTISELDMICSLGQVSLTSGFVRPKFGPVLNLKGALHPILNHIEPTKPTPNDVMATRGKNFNIITGPNMSGKTIYVLKIALLHIIAQIGSYVPADSAEFRITDYIYVRKDSSESIDKLASSFIVELKELMYTVSNTTANSLIIIDELCAGTNFDGGIAVSWAIAEEFLKRRAFTFLTTHYHYLCKMEKIYSNVTCWHMEAIEREELGTLSFTHRLLPGVTQVTNYGLKLILTTSLPQSIKDEVRRVSERLSRKNAMSSALVIPFSEEALKTMREVDRLEKFIKYLYDLTQNPDQYTLEAVQRLQQYVIQELEL